VETADLPANLAAELKGHLEEPLKDTIKNVVLNLGNVKTMAEETAEVLVRIQQKYYEQNASFVVCELSAAMEQFLDEKELLEMMNVTPTESEASDIVQMEEVERELLDGDDFDG
jgi:anti-anti-sigma factor